ncbi:hypothetical protein [Nocardioides sp. SYSU DS0651]|uniref:hypothetical protein n=1 Tax=Nocardioides sp. SYSU DS0651 TaxID=3415955 RepID=UPI003F4BD26C
MAGIEAAAERGGTDAAFDATWDVILGEAEGMTTAEASERGLRLDPSAYAIPEGQARVVQGIWHRHRGHTGPSFLWLQMGPATYADAVDDVP